MNGKKFLFVLNPISGGKSKQEFLFLVGKFCALNNLSYISYPTLGDGTDELAIEELIRAHRPDAVVAVGGDGTINLVARLLIDHSIPLGIIPLGSANGLARDLHIPNDVIKALDIIYRYKVHSIDLLRVNGLYSFHMADLGFNAGIVNRFAGSVTRGKISYAWYGLQEFFSYKPFNYEIETDQVLLKGQAFMVSMTNGNRFGNNLNINPLGSIDDGYFEISIIKPFKIPSSFNILYHLLHDTLHRSSHNRVIRSRNAIIRTTNCDAIHVDGEPMEMNSQLDVGIVPGGLRVIVP